jgi:hypothetical protein
VLIVSREGDIHGDVVAQALEAQGASVGRMSAKSLVRSGVRWRLGEVLDLDLGSGYVGSVSESTTVWWRRLGRPSTAGLGKAEAELVLDEISALSVGILEASGVRWVDAPWVAYRAGLKPYQLAVAKRLGIATPATWVTNEPESAREFDQCYHPLIAKATSSGKGIAPFVAEVPLEMLELLSACPVLLQKRIEAHSDLRVVTIGSRSLVWVRPRKPSDGPDWREVDPGGKGFREDLSGGLGDYPVNMAKALGLSFSVQDWLLTDVGPVFLEANPRGQWLFLDKAADLVVPVLTQFLMSSA